MHAAGYPATCEELDTWYTIPAFADNAADYLSTAVSHLVWPSKEDANGVPLFSNTPLPARIQPLDERTRQLTASMIVANSKTLDLLRQGVEIPDCRYPLDFSRAAIRNSATSVPFDRLHDCSYSRRLWMPRRVIPMLRFRPW